MVSSGHLPVREGESSHSPYLKTNSYYNPINALSKIAIARSKYVIQKAVTNSTLVLCIIVLVLLLALTSVAKADLEIKPRVWKENPYQNKN